MSLNRFKRASLKDKHDVLENAKVEKVEKKTGKEVKKTVSKKK